MSNQERFAGKSRFSTGAKAASVVFTVGLAALLMARTPMHLPEASLVPAPTVVEQSEGQTGAPGLTLSAEQYEVAVRAAKQEDAPAPTF
jgi:hypothetical protein